MMMGTKAENGLHFYSFTASSFVSFSGRGQIVDANHNVAKWRQGKRADAGERERR